MHQAMHAKPLSVIVAFVAILSSVSSLTVVVENNNPPFHNGCRAGRPLTKESLNRLDEQDQRDPTKSTDAVMQPSFVIRNFEPGSSCRSTRVRAMPEKNSNPCTNDRIEGIMREVKKKAHPLLATIDLVKEAPLEEYGGGKPINISFRMPRTRGGFETDNIDTLQGFLKCNPSLIRGMNHPPDMMDWKKKNGTIEIPQAIDVTKSVVQHDQRHAWPLGIRPPTMGLGVSKNSAKFSRESNSVDSRFPTKLQ